MPRKPHIKDNLVCFLMLIFEEHLEVITTKINKAIGPLRKLEKTLPRPLLIIMYKAFVRPHLDYGDVIYGGFYNKTFTRNLNLFNTRFLPKLIRSY